MKNIVVVYLLAEFNPDDKRASSLVFKYQDGGTYLPTLGEYVYFSDSSMKFQITAREHFYVDDDTLRIIYRLNSPVKVDEKTRKALHAPLI